MYPPPLAWLSSFAASTSVAGGFSITAQASATVNPLVYDVILRFGETLSGDTILLIWNLFQMWAAKNESIPQGKNQMEGNQGMQIQVMIKRRLGAPKDEHPLG